MPLALLLTVGNLVLVGSILAIVFTTVARRTRVRYEAAMVELRAEGIVREGGPYRGWIHFRNYRRPGYTRARAVEGARKSFVLTRKSFALLGRWVERIPLADLARYSISVGEDSGKLVIATDQPVVGSGHVEWRLNVPDADAWLAKLRESGMRAA